MPLLVGSLDANVLLRLILNDITDQHQAAVKLLRGATGKFAVADTAFIEVVFVLERNYQLNRSQIAEAIEGLASLMEINCNNALIENALPIFKSHPGLTFEDCCLATYASLSDAEPLWTFDKKLSSQVKNTKLVEA